MPLPFPRFQRVRNADEGPLLDVSRGNLSIEERSFDCVPRRAETARRKKRGTSLRMTAHCKGAPVSAGWMADR
jgi:hypothetical protein